MFLTAAEIRLLTGYVKPGKQAEWLQRNRVRHWIARTGRPVVPRSAIDAAPERAQDERPFELGHVA
jgi:hypothetical protein